MEECPDIEGARAAGALGAADDLLFHAVAGHPLGIAFVHYDNVACVFEIDPATVEAGIG